MKIKKISLRNLNDEVLAANELTHISGGFDCGCACNGSSSTSDNMSANFSGGLVSGACNVIGYDGENMEIVGRPHA